MHIKIANKLEEALDAARDAELMTKDLLTTLYLERAAIELERANFRAKRQKKDEKKRKKRIIFEKGVDRYFRMCYN